MIASENFAPRSVLQAQGSVLTNKYAEGLPAGVTTAAANTSTRWKHRPRPRQGVVRRRIRQRATAFGCAGQRRDPARADDAGERLLGLDLANGGHLTHGMRLNFSGKLYETGFYGVDPVTHLIDMDAVRARAREFRPKVLIAGWSAYPRTLDFAAFRSIADEVGAKLWVDMAHFAGLVAAGLHPSPVPPAHVVSTTVHKTLGGAGPG
ncbi:serine hydroxymethyltransferase family protein [Mycobacterium xenopi 4042]|uniref:Serine hydroxymethyltransferase family protein n=1 Tax=Mycobacterium xenopi 4042 TaxID=1299334 RepID=X8ALP6_MYCXE|nr:serine hydroxymethyltransferase family protein [Mycobacterium xenopi 4042]